MQMNIIVRYRWALFVASYILGHLCGVKVKLYQLLGTEDCINQEIEGCSQSAVKELVSLALADDLSHSGCSRVLDVTSPQVSRVCTDMQ